MFTVLFGDLNYFQMNLFCFVRRFLKNLNVPGLFSDKVIILKSGILNLEVFRGIRGSSIFTRQLAVDLLS